MNRELVRFPKFRRMSKKEVRQTFPKATRDDFYRLDWETFDNQMRREHEVSVAFGLHDGRTAVSRESLESTPLPPKYEEEVRTAAFNWRLAPSKEIRWHIRSASDAFFYLCAEYPCDDNDEIRIAPAIQHTEAAFRLLCRELLYCPKRVYLAEAMLIKLWFYQLVIWGRLHSLPPYDTAEAKRERTAFRREIVLGNARFFELKEKNPPGAADFIESVSALWGL